MVVERIRTPLEDIQKPAVKLTHHGSDCAPLELLADPF